MSERRFDYNQIDELLHSRIRLAIVSVLARCEEAEFTYLRDEIGATDGNLAVHCRKLEDAGYIVCKKRFVGRKPSTSYSLTQVGRDALVHYAKTLTEMIPSES